MALKILIALIVLLIIITIQKQFKVGNVRDAMILGFFDFKLSFKVY